MFKLICYEDVEGTETVVTTPTSYFDFESVRNEVTVKAELLIPADQEEMVGFPINVPMQKVGDKVKVSRICPKCGESL